MKRIGILFVSLMSIISGCEFRSVSDQLVEIDSLLTAEQNDSAYRQLLSIAQTNNLNEVDRAYYNLLMTRASYLVNKPLKSDSLLDMATIYFLQHEDKEKLADCYYFKSIKFHLDKNYEQAIQYSKKAEKMAEGANNRLLSYKITDNLSILNRICGNDQLSLEDARKSLNQANEEKNSEWIAYAYYRIGMALVRLGKGDSALYYFSKAEPYIKYVRKTDLPHFLSNLSLVYLDKNPEKSKALLYEALSLKELTSALEQLADIYYDEGKTEEAYSLWERALTVNDFRPKDNVIHNLLEYDIEHGKTDNVCQRVNDIIAIKDSIINTLQNDTIRDLQVRFDHQVELNAANERLIRWQWVLGGMVLLVVCLLIILTWNRLRTKMKLKDRQMQIDKYVKQVGELKLKKTQAELQISNLQNEKKQNECFIREIQAQKEQIEQEIVELDSMMKALTDKEVAKVRKGALLYADLEDNKKVVFWTDKDYESLVAFYSTLNSEKMRKVQKKYNNLTLRNMLYLILKEMGKSKAEICDIMGLEDSSYRSMESRIRSKAKK